MFTRWFRALLVLVLVGWLAACGGSDAPPPSETSATLGAAGGTLNGPDGVQLIVPAGALAQDTLIRIARTGTGAPALPDGYTASTPSYEFTPHGLNFLLPVTIRMPYVAPAGAAHADLFMATPGADWQAMQATVSNGMASWSRLSFSYLDGLWCVIPANNTDPYACLWTRLGAPLSATPPTVLVQQAVDNRMSQSTLSAATTLHFTLNYSAAPDCGDPRVRILRINNGVGPASTLLDQAVASLTPAVGSTQRATGSTTFDLPMTHADNGTVWFGVSFACTRTGRARTSDGYAHLVTVAIPATAAPTITQQPASAAVVEPAAATFTAAAGGAPAPTVQWQVSTDAGTTWTDIAGATAASYQTPATVVADTGRQYRAVFSNSPAVVPSQAAVLTVTAAPIAPTFGTQPSNQSVTAGATATFTTAASGMPTPTLQWQLSADAGVTWSDIAGATSASYTTAATTLPDTGLLYRLVASNSAGVVASSAALLTVNPAPVGKLALVANSGVTNGTNGLSVYRVNATTGALSFLNNVNAGNSPCAIAVSPNGLYAYVTNQMGGTVSSYSIDSANGVVSLIPLSSPSSNNASGIAMDRLGRFIWVTNYGWNTLSAFSIGANGVLAAVGSPLATTISLPYAITAHPTLDVVYVAHQSNSAVTVYGVNPATGALTLQQTLNYVIVAPSGLVVDPSGRFAYALSQTGGVSVFSINSRTGLLSYVGATSTNGAAFAIAVHPNGKYVYVTIGDSSNNVVVFAINQSTGALTAVGSPYATGNYPRGVAVDAAGSYLYVTNYGSNNVTAFSISGGGGALTSLGTVASTGINPQGIATTP